MLKARKKSLKRKKQAPKPHSDMTKILESSNQEFKTTIINILRNLQAET